MHLINCFSATFEENTNNINLKVRSRSTTHASQSRFAKCISSSQRIVSSSDILFHSMTVTKWRNFTLKSIYIIMHISNMFESSIRILNIKLNKFLRFLFRHSADRNSMKYCLMLESLFTVSILMGNVGLCYLM